MPSARTAPTGTASNSRSVPLSLAVLPLTRPLRDRRLHLSVVGVQRTHRLPISFRRVHAVPSLVAFVVVLQLVLDPSLLSLKRGRRHISEKFRQLPPVRAPVSPLNSTSVQLQPVQTLDQLGVRLSFCSLFSSRSRRRSTPRLHRLRLLEHHRRGRSRGTRRARAARQRGGRCRLSCN